MKKNLYFDLEKSREKLRLVYQRPIGEIFDLLLFVVLASGMFIAVTFWAIHMPPENENFGFVVYFIFPLVSFFCMYSVFRKIKERKLFRITTHLSGPEIRRILLAFLEEKEYQYHKINMHVIFASEQEPSSYGRLWSKDLVFILNDGELLFNIRKNFPEINPPVLITHFIVKRQLINRLNESELRQRS